MCGVLQSEQKGGGLAERRSVNGSKERQQERCFLVENMHREYFNQKAPQWDSMLTEEVYNRLKRIISSLKIKPGSVVLDVGTGTGVLLPFLLEAAGPGGKIVALDIAEKMLEIARAKVGDRAELVCGDITAAPFADGTFDEVICNSCFPHVKDKLQALKEIARILKPGGRLAVCHPMSREAVNNLHRSLGGVVGDDLLPEHEEMHELCGQAGFWQTAITDVAEMYLLTARKPVLSCRERELVPIGIIHSPYRSTGEAPRQGRFSDQTAELEVYPPFREGLKDVERATHLVVLYWCHLASRQTLQTRTPYGPEVRGVFACRSPARPNPIAFCVAELLEVKEGRLLVRGVDALDKSPLLDIKPYSSAIDSVAGASIGWLEDGSKKVKG